MPSLDTLLIEDDEDDGVLDDETSGEKKAQPLSGVLEEYPCSTPVVFL